MPTEEHVEETPIDDGLQHLIDEGEKGDEGVVVEGAKESTLKAALDDKELKDETVVTLADGKTTTLGELRALRAGDEGDDEGVDPADLTARLDSLETKYGEREQEIIFLRAELAKANRREPERVKPEADDINLDEVVASLTDKDPKVAARKIIELATKIADKKVAGMRDETTGLLRSNQQIVTLKETDRANVMADFGDYLDDKDFEKVMTDVFNNTSRAAGRYVPDSLYSAAATAKHIIDKARAKKAGEKNGVKIVRPGAPKNPVEADTHDYSKAVTIDGLGTLATAREKAAMKGVLKRLKDQGVTEKQYVENWLAENGR